MGEDAGVTALHGPQPLSPPFRKLLERRWSLGGGSPASLGFGIGWEAGTSHGGHQKQTQGCSSPPVPTAPQFAPEPCWDLSQFHVVTSPIRASNGQESPEREAAKHLLPSDLNICMLPNFPSKSTVLFKGLNARIMRIRSTSRQPDIGRETADEGGEGRGGSIIPGPNERKRKAPSASLRSGLFISKSTMVIPINPVWVWVVGLGLVVGLLFFFPHFFFILVFNCDHNISPKGNIIQSFSSQKQGLINVMVEHQERRG